MFNPTTRSDSIHQLYTPNSCRPDHVLAFE